MLPSNYPNPLDNYRTYSYHFILTLANSTEAHRKLLEKDGFMSAVNGVGLGGELKLDGEKAFLLVDTRRFSQYSITSFETSQIYGTGSPDNPSVPASTTKIKLVDSTGLSFFNYLMDTMKNKLQSTRSSAFFMLAIVFTGHTDDETTTTISTCYIPMVLINMGFEFSSNGSTYDIEFMEIEGNPGAGVPQLVDLGDIKAISTENKSNTVGGMIQSLEDNLNLSSLRFFQKYTNEALTRTSSAQQKNFTQAGKLVQYMITLPKEWENFSLNTAGKSTNTEQVFLAKTKKQQAEGRAQLDAAVSQAQLSGNSEQLKSAIKARDSYKSFSFSTTIPDAIKVILESSKEYLMLASTEKRKAGEAMVHKTVVNVTSDQTSYVVHYDIYPYRAPKVKPDDKGTNGAVQTSSATRKLSNGQIRNLISYDYIFSGKNSHVLDLKIEFSPHAAAAGLDMDLNMGQSRFAENSIAGQKTGSVDAASNGLNKTIDFNPLMRAGEPVFSPTSTREQSKNFVGQNVEEMKSAEAISNLKAKQEHSSTMAVLHFLGSLQTQLTIRGNPNLIRKYADRNVRGGVAPHTIPMSAVSLKQLTTTPAEKLFKTNLKPTITGGKEKYYKDFVKPRQDDKQTSGTDPLINGGDISGNPVFVKVNIFAPNVDFEGNTIPGDPMFTNKFFFDGVYMIAIITHTFENGTFKHVMTLIPYDVDGSFSASTASSVTETVKKKI
jgi:hypothetical protein